jgi:hypothetical protein
MIGLATWGVAKALRTVGALLASLVGAAVAVAGDGAAVRNWFNDPFFQVTNADATCPLPAGPFVDERGRAEQTHRRAEKGTTCWLAGQCDRPKAYLYDPDIAAGVKRAFAASARFKDTTLWVTVQGRVVYIEGCARAPATAQAVESLVRAVPHVDQAIAILHLPASNVVPHRVRPSASSNSYDGR